MPAKPDLSEFEEVANNQPTVCVVMRSRARLSDEDREKFDAAISLVDDDGVFVYGDNTIGTWLHRRGLSGRGQAVAKHRRGACCCA